MFSNKWYPLVYSRTYEVDFRMIAMPKSIQDRDRDKQSILDYILSTTRQPEELVTKPRFSLFKGKKLCVVGITCVGYELIANYGEERYSDKTHDIGNRPVYGFFGYVAKLDESKELAIPTNLEMMKFENFQNLYEYIARNWWSKEYGDSIDSESQSIDNPFGESPLQEYIENNNSKDFNLNRNPEEIHVWTDRDRERIWSLAAKDIRGASSISLCLGVPSPRDALASCFLNATASIEQKKVLVRESSKPPSSDKIPPEQNSEFLSEQDLSEIGKDILEKKHNIFDLMPNVSLPDLNIEESVKQLSRLNPINVLNVLNSEKESQKEKERLKKQVKQLEKENKKLRKKLLELDPQFKNSYDIGVDTINTEEQIPDFYNQLSNTQNKKKTEKKWF